MADEKLNRSEKGYDIIKQQNDEIQLLLDFIEQHEDESSEYFEEIKNAKMKIINNEISMINEAIEIINDNNNRLNKIKKLDILNKRMWYLSTILSAFNTIDINNLEPLIFPGIIGVSFITKDKLVKNKYKLCYDDPKTLNTNMFIKYAILKMAFNVINLLAIIKMKEYYGADSDSFYQMLILIIYGYLTRFFSRKLKRTDEYIINNDVKLNLLKETLNELNECKEYLKSENETELIKIKKR